MEMLLGIVPSHSGMLLTFFICFQSQFDIYVPDRNESHTQMIAQCYLRERRKKSRCQHACLDPSSLLLVGKLWNVFLTAEEKCENKE